MKVLVTGATGFVGGHLVKELSQKNYEIRILHRPKSDLSSISSLNFESIVGNISSKIDVSKACVGVDVVFHLAGFVGYSKDQRGRMEHVNVRGTKNIIEACLDHKVKRLVHMSSVAAIGASFRKISLNEDARYNISHLNLGYFETKRKAENLVIKACKDSSLNAVILNPSTIYGAGDAKKGSRKVQLKVAQGKFSFYPPGGVNVVHIQDVIGLLLAAIENGKSGERYIVCGENFLIKDLFAIIAEEAGVSPPKIPLPKLILQTLGIIGDLFEKFNKKISVSSETAHVSSMYHWFDSSKTQEEFNWTPRSSREAIKESVSWAKENIINYN